MKKYVGLALAAAVMLAAGACDEALQKGSIAGNVKDNGAPAGGVYVLLLDEGQLITGNTPLSNGSITQANGNYNILMVEPNKKYYVAAVRDADNNVMYTPGVDSLGYYGTYNQQTGVWVPTSLYVGEGQNLTGINVADLYEIPAP